MLTSFQSPRDLEPFKLKPKVEIVPTLPPAKISVASLKSSYFSSNLIAYGANTHNGLRRSYNEDRISIVLDLKPS